MFSARRFSPLRLHLIIALSLTCAGTVALWYAFGAINVWPRWLVSWLIAINVVALGYFGFDKQRSRSATAGRVPEAVLHGLAAAGGSLGAYAGMQLFRHKTLKGPFRILFWGIVILQIALLVWIAKLVWWD